jgi:hypothetical protein
MHCRFIGGLIRAYRHDLITGLSSIRVSIRCRPFDCFMD